MTSWRRVDDVCAAVRDAVAQGDLAAGLETIAAFVTHVISHESSIAVVFSSPELDQLCQEIGRAEPAMNLQLPDQDRAVFLVTALYPTGGHGRMLLELIQADPCRKATVLMSNTHNSLQQKDVAKLAAAYGIDIELAPAANLAVRLKWMQDRLAALRPARTYILTHHQDPVCVASAQPELVGKLYYYHNCDHSLALGVHLPHATHIDFHGKGYHHCRDVNGLENNVFWPLTAAVPKHRLAEPFLADGTLTTCTSGGFEKFENSRFLEPMPYLYEYPRIVPQILKATGGTHVHMGGLPDPMRNQIAQGLAAIGLPAGRFVYIPYVPDLGRALVERQADVYIGSFPLGGGRAIVEAMGAGMPMIIHSNYRSVFFSDVGEAYPGVMEWRTPDELIRHLTTLTRTELTDHAQRARAHYEANHAPEMLLSAVRATLAGRPPVPPRRPAHRPNPLQRWLDARAAPALAAGLRAAPAAGPPSGFDSKLAARVAALERDNENLHRKVARLAPISRGVTRLAGWLGNRPPEYALIKSSGLFDEAWYLGRYPDVAENGQDPVLHYLRHGAEEGRDPSPLFHTVEYLQAYPDVGENGMNPLVHYIRHGLSEGRKPRIA